VNIKNNLTTILVACLAALLIVALTVIVITGNNPDKYIGSISTLVGLLITAGVIGPRLDKVSKNVNGNTTRLMNTIDQQNALIVSLGGTPVQTDGIEQIAADRDSLPAHRSE